MSLVRTQTVSLEQAVAQAAWVVLVRRDGPTEVVRVPAEASAELSFAWSNPESTLEEQAQELDQGVRRLRKFTGIAGITDAQRVLLDREVLGVEAYCQRAAPLQFGSALSFCPGLLAHLAREEGLSLDRVRVIDAYTHVGPEVSPGRSADLDGALRAMGQILLRLLAAEDATGPLTCVGLDAIARRLAEEGRAAFPSPGAVIEALREVRIVRPYERPLSVRRFRVEEILGGPAPARVGESLECVESRELRHQETHDWPGSGPDWLQRKLEAALPNEEDERWILLGRSRQVHGRYVVESVSAREREAVAAAVVEGDPPAPAHPKRGCLGLALLLLLVLFVVFS